MSDVAGAVAPAHLTAVFSVHRGSSPLTTGARGAGITLSEGVSVTARADGRSGQSLNGHDSRIAAVDAVRREFESAASVTIEAAVPVGAGFGVSGAAALATAYTLNTLEGAALSETELTRIAHEADVQAGTGLGDVVAQARGGVPIRVEPGGPGVGELDGIPERRSIEYLSFGALDTSDILGGDTARIDSAGETALETLQATPTLPTLFEVSRTFTRETGLASDRVREVIDAVTDGGGLATMAMLGETVVALDDGLSVAGFDPVEATISDAGVHVVPSSEV